MNKKTLYSIIVTENPSMSGLGIVLKKQVQNRHLLIGWVPDNPLIDSGPSIKVIDFLSSVLSKVFQFTPSVLR